MLWISVVLVVGDHWVSGLVSADGRRLLDMLNDKTSEFLTLTEARLYLAVEMTEPAATLPKAIVPKANIVFAMLLDESHEAPRKRATSFTRKEAYETYMTVPSLEIKGYVHLLQRADPAGFMLKLAKDGLSFFPVTLSAVSTVGPFGEPTAAPVTLVNRAHVDLFYLADTPTIL